jgi:dephospho-CoA kinase
MKLSLLQELGVWGLVGGIGSGKTAVAQILSDLGCLILHADEIAKSIRNQDPEVQEWLARELKTTDPEEIRKAIFSDPHLKHSFEKLMHPKIEAASLKEFQAWRKSHPAHLPMFYEATEIIANGRASEFAGILLVKSNLTLRLHRLMDQRGLGEEDARKIIQAQTPQETLEKHATFCIENDSDLKTLRKETQSILAQILLRQSPSPP